MNSGYLTISGSKIYYEITGNGEPLIFLHADTLDSRQWQPQVDYFSSNYQVITYDIRGFGKSDLPSKEHYSFSEDLYLLMERLNIKTANIVGLSMGAAIAIDFALTHPDMVTTLTLADAGISGDGFGEEFISAIGKIISHAKKMELDKTKQTWSDLHIFDFSRSNPKVWDVVTTMVQDTSCYRWYGNNQPINISPPAAASLTTITVPTLIIIGEHDIPDFQRKAKLLKEKVPNSKLVTISSSGHLSNLDNPILFNQVLSEFLNSQSQ
jgi:3-oxoadipate enol-lactonase